MVYVREDCKGRGIGSTLLNKSIATAKNLGYRSIIAVIASDQPSSITLHHKYGFKMVAHLHQVGFKLGQWIDVVYLQLLV